MNYPITKKNNAIYIIPFPFYRSNKNPKLCGGADVDYPATLSVIAPYPVFCGVAVPSVPAARYCRRSFVSARLLSLPPILFFGRGQGRRGRATAKPTNGRRGSTDGFVVGMDRTKGRE